VTDHRAIGLKYVKSWFFFDLFGGLPVDWAFSSTWDALMTPPEQQTSDNHESGNAVQA
jgi:hypothetical protein